VRKPSYTNVFTQSKKCAKSFLKRVKKLLLFNLTSVYNINMKKIFFSLLTLIIIMQMAFLMTGCDRTPPWTPHEITLDTPEIFFRGNTTNSTILWDTGFVTGGVLLRATHNSETHYIELTPSFRQIDLVTIEQIRTAPYYEIQIKAKGFNIMSPTEDGRIDWIHHDSEWSNTLVFRNYLAPKAPTNLRIVNSGIDIAFDIGERITGLNYMVTMFVDGVAGSERRIDPIDGEITVRLDHSLPLTGAWDVEAQIRFEINNPSMGVYFNQYRTLSTTVAKSDPLNISRQFLETPAVTNVNNLRIEWQPVEHATHYQIRVFGRGQFLQAVHRDISITAGTSFCFEEYYELTGFNILNWNTYSEGPNDFFFFSIRPIVWGGTTIVDNTLYMSPSHGTVAGGNLNRLYV